MSTRSLVFDRTAQTEILTRLGTLLQDHYVFVDVGATAAAALAAHLGAGDYDDLTDPYRFVDTLNEHLYAVCRDKHLRLRFCPDGPPLAVRKDVPVEEMRQLVGASNGGFHRVERMAGNIGYLDLRAFCDPRFAGEIAVHAMGFLTNTSALMIDLRQNGGGSADMVTLLCSYLLSERSIQTNSFQWRGREELRQIWTLPYVPGRRYLENPVYVLISQQTASAAEELSYNIQVHKRGTLVGEVTAGAAHNGKIHWLTEQFGVFIPSGRAVNPITKQNWEGTGVVPDVAVPSEEALQVAHRLALQAVLERLEREPSGAYQELLVEVRGAFQGAG